MRHQGLRNRCPWTENICLGAIESCFEKAMFFWLGFKPSTVLVPIMILLFGCFFPTQVRYFGVHVRMLGCQHVILGYPCHHLSFLQPLQTGLAFCVGWMLEAIEGFGGCLVGNFGNFFALTPTPSGKLSCPTSGKDFEKECHLQVTPVTWGIPLVRGSGELL